MADRPILVISGTNRPSSNTLRVAQAVAEHYRRQNLAVDLFDVTDMPREVFEPTVYAAKPPAFVRVQQRAPNPRCCARAANCFVIGPVTRPGGKQSILRGLMPITGIASHGGGACNPVGAAYIARLLRKGAASCCTQRLVFSRVA